MVAVYCRQSVDKKDSISIETQANACRGMLFGEESREYSDKGFSGGNTDRPAFRRLMDDIGRGVITKVAVYRLDRISRSLLDFANIMDVFEKNRISFVSATENFDTSTPMGRAMLGIIMVFAQLERETIRLRIRDNFYERAKKGLFLAGKAPFGFKKIPQKIDGVHSGVLREFPEEGRVVRYIFGRYLSGESIGKIVRELNGENCPCYTGRKFSAAFIGRLLRNPVYVRANAEVFLYLKAKGAIFHNDISEFDGVHGLTVYGSRSEKSRSKFVDMSGENIQLNLHEGLIDAGDWLRVQEILSKNKALKNTGRGKNTWLSGLTRCGYCGAAVFVVGGQKNGKRYLNCGGRKENRCRGRTRVFTFDMIENIVEKRLLGFIGGFRFGGAKNCPKNDSEINELRIRLDGINREISVIVERMSEAGEVMTGYLNERIEHLDREKKDVLGELSRLLAASSPPDDKNKFGEFFCAWEALSLETKKAAAGLFIKSVVITDEEIVIEYNI